MPGPGAQMLSAQEVGSRRPAPAAARARRVAAGLACVVLSACLALGGTAAADLSASSVRWDSAAYGGGADLTAVSFWGSARGFAVGRSGAIICSRDGGASWTTASADTTADLYDVCVDAGGGVHAVGAGGTIVSSPDGVSWRSIDPDAQGDLYGIDFADPAHGWAVGPGGTVLMTSDGGATWGAAGAGVDTSAALTGVDFADALDGWVWGGSGAIHATRDGGLTWDSTQVSPEATLRAGCFTSATEGWVGGTNSLLARTSDGGETWAFRSLPATGTVLAIDFCDALHGAVLIDEGTGGTAIGSTGDGGETWDVVRVPDALRSLSVADGLHTWAVGSAGAVLRTVEADAPAMATSAVVVPPPLVTAARAMPDGSVLVGWSDVPGASGYVVRRSVAGGPFDVLVTLEAGAQGLRDTPMDAGDVVAYSVAARFIGIESAPGPVAAAQACALPEDPPSGPGPTEMSCTGCHVVHTTGPTGDPASAPLWCLDCHPSVQRELAGADPSTRHDLLATDAGAERLGLSCTDCHSPHSSSEATPLIDPDHPERGLAVASNEFCFSCHDGGITQHVLERESALGLNTAAPADVRVAWGSAEHTASMDVHGFGRGDPRLRPGTGLQAGAVLRCEDCHAAHGSTNRWSLSESLTTGGAARYTGLLVEPIEDGGADLRLFCGACHLLDMHPPVASGGADLNRWPIDCTPCHRHGSGM